MVASLQDIRKKRESEKKKITAKFGEKTKYDVSVEQIEKHGLEAMVLSSVPLCYFICLLLQVDAIENFLFYDEIDFLKRRVFQSEEEKNAALAEIYETFIRSGAEFEVNIASQQRNRSKAELDAGNIDCFEEAKEHILGLLVPAFDQFIREGWAEEMRSIYGETNYYSIEETAKAVARVKKSLDELFRAAQGASENASALLVRRVFLLRSFVHLLLQRRLEMDFVDEVPSEDVKLVERSENPF